MNGNAMKIYMAKGIADGKSYQKKVLRPVFGILALLMMFVIGSVFTAVSMGWEMPLPLQWTLVVLLMLLLAGSVVVLLGAGANAARNALVFFLINDTLYAVDARPLYKAKWMPQLTFVYRFFKSISDTARTLDRIAGEEVSEEELLAGKIGTDGARIVEISKLQAASGKRLAHCNVITVKGNSAVRKYDITNHTPALVEILKETL